MPSTISSSVAPFFSCLQSFPATGTFSMSCLFEPGGQSTGASASALVFPVNIQDWFPLGWTGLISLNFNRGSLGLKDCGSPGAHKICQGAESPVIPRNPGSFWRDCTQEGGDLLPTQGQSAHSGAGPSRLGPGLQGWLPIVTLLQGTQGPCRPLRGQHWALCSRPHLHRDPSMVLSRKGAFSWGPRAARVPGASGRAGMRLCSAQSPHWRMCWRGWGIAGVPKLLFTLRVCTPHLQGPTPQGNQWAPLLERRSRVTRKDSKTESSRTPALHWKRSCRQGKGRPRILRGESLTPTFLLLLPCTCLSTVKGSKVNAGQVLRRKV